MFSQIISALIAFSISVGTLIGVSYTKEVPVSQGITPEVTLGAFSDPFVSIQLASSPVNGNCLTTDGTDNVWGSCGGVAGNWATTSEAYYWSQFRDFTVQGDGYLAPTTTRGVILSASSTISALTVTTGTTTYATTTSLFSTTASSTNLFSSLLTVGGTGLVVDSSRNVAIGYASPANKLDVAGSLSLANSGYLGFMGNSAVGSTNYSLFGNTTLTLLNARSGASIGFRIANTDVANFNTSGGFGFGSTYYNIDAGANNMIIEGNVGIGASAPTTKLEVQGGLLVNNSTSTITNIFSINSTSTNATSTNLSISGTLDVDGLTSALTLTGSTGIFAEYAGTSCTNQFVRSLDALGGATCATVSSGDVSLANLTATDSTLTFSGTYNGATARTIGLNLASANVWTASTTFTGGLTAVTGTTTSATSTNLYVSSSVSIASTSPVRAFSVHGNAIISGDVFLGATTTATTSEQYVGRISPWRYLTLSTATTTAGVASTTGSAYSPYVIAPFSGTIRQVRCSTDTSFLGVNTQIAGSNTAPSYFVASTSVGTVTFTGSNTFTVGQKILMNVGTTTNWGGYSVSCTYGVTESP
jgi:hypothetical protein